MKGYFFIFFPFVLNLNFVYINATSFLLGMFSLLLCRVYPLQFVIFEFAVVIKFSVRNLFSLIFSFLRRSPPTVGVIAIYKLGVSLISSVS